MEIVDTIHIKVLQQFESQAIFQILLIEAWKMKCCGTLLLAIKEKKNSYRFIIESLLFSVRITNDAKAISVTCNSLNHAEAKILHDKDYNTLGVANLGQITNWLSVKGSSNWVGVNFVDTNYPTEGSNFAFVFNSKNLNVLTKFSFKMLDGKQQYLNLMILKQIYLTLILE